MTRFDRFIQKVNIEPTLDTVPCWNWTGATVLGRVRKTVPIARGYFRDGKRGVLAHRWIYMQVVGEIPRGKELDHLCRNPLCVRPSHLEAVTHSENVKRGTSWHHLVDAAGEVTHCPQGHRYSEENTYTDKLNTRHCRNCNRTRNRKGYKAQPKTDMEG